MSARTRVNFDTSILFNYVYTKLPGEIANDRHSVRLLDTPDYYCVVGGKAKGEFERGCDRRNALYDDILDWLDENPDATIYDYDVVSRDVAWSPNDRRHVRFEIQHAWADEPRRKQLADLRRCKQDIAAFREQLSTRILDRVYDQMENEDLLDELEGLSLDHDKEIVIDAVEIHRTDGINLLASRDSDLTDDSQSEKINDVIRRIEGESLLLRIVAPDEI